jgi:hypothetical protein
VDADVPRTPWFVPFPEAAFAPLPLAFAAPTADACVVTVEENTDVPAATVVELDTVAFVVFDAVVVFDVVVFDVVLFVWPGVTGVDVEVVQALDE